MSEISEMFEKHIIHKEQPAEFTSKLYLNMDYADVIFIVEKERFPAIRCILAVSSEYFRGLLYGGFAESEKKEIELDVKLEPFKAILKYVYTGTFTYDINDNELMLDVLELANTYDYQNLVLQLAENLIECINIDNVACILTIAFRYNLENLYNAALRVIDRKAKEFIEHESFLTLSQNLVAEIINRDEFKVYELDIFNAIIKWSKGKAADDLKFILPHIRFTLMQIDELRENVATTGVLQTSEISDIIKNIKEFDCLPYRNGSTHRNQLKLIDVQNDEESSYKGSWSDKSVMLKLPTEKIINHICFNKRHCSNMSYYIEVSQDQREWTRICDYRKHVCCRRQHLYFKLCKVRYVYIAVNCAIGEFYFSTKYKDYLKSRIFDGFLAPYRNYHEIDIELNKAAIKNEENFILAKFRQPLFINCLEITFNGMYFVVSEIETSFDGKEFKKIEFQHDYFSRILFFESHVINAAKITFTYEPSICSVKGFYQPGSMEYIALNPCESTIVKKETE